MIANRDVIARDLRGLRQERRGPKVHQHALGRGALLQPMGAVIHFMPPYLSTPDEIRPMAKVAAEDIDLATR